MKKLLIMLLTLVLALTCYIPTNHVLAKDMTVIDVTDFNADKSGYYDSTEAFMKALEKAKEIDGPVTINFPYGEYRFDEDHTSTRVIHTSNTSSRSYPEKKISLLLEDMHNLTIEGNDSTLLFYGDIMAIGTINSSNVTFRNFVLDYKDADTIDISIVETGKDENGHPYADIFVPAAYNYTIRNNPDGTPGITWHGDISEKTGESYWNWENADFCAYLVVYKGYDRTVIRANNKEASNPFTKVNEIQKVSDTVLRFTYESALPKDVVEGNIYQLSNSAIRRTAGAFFYESEDLLVENIDVHYLSGFGWLTQMCKNVEFKGVDFLPRVGSGKYTTSNADQLHVAGCGGYFKVTDCHFSMAHDDPINVHGTYMRVEEVIDNKTLRMKYIHGQQGGFKQFHNGDEVLFYSRTYLESPDGQDEDRPFIVQSSIAPGESYNGSQLDLVSEIVTFKEDLPQSVIDDLKKTITKNNEVQPLYVAENVTYTPEVTISGNKMKSIPTRGILCTTRKPVVIENNIFDNMAMASIYLSNDADDWYESGPIRNLTIRNNTFYVRETGQSVVGTVSGVFIEPITVASWTLSGQVPSQKDPDSLVHKNITIEDNTFYMSNDNVVTANKVDGLVIRNNTIIREEKPILSIQTHETLGIGDKVDIEVQVSERILQKPVFQLNNCKNVVIDNNDYDNGFNLNVGLSQTPIDHVHISSHDASVLKVNTASLTGSDHKVQLISSDPTIAYINENKELVGVKEGKVTIMAYVESLGTIVKSEPVEVSVLNTESMSLDIDADKTLFKNKNEQVQIESSLNDVKYEVLDPVTLKSTDKAIIDSNGLYTAKKDGTVLVKVTKNQLSKTLLMINSFDVSYGKTLKNYVKVDQASNNGLSSIDEHAITIYPQNNGNGLYNASASVNNVVNLSLADYDQDDLRIQVDVSGMVLRGSGWNSSGVMLYNDQNNYVFVGKRNHFDGMSTMNERHGLNCSEIPGANTDNTLTDTTLEFKIVNDTLTIAYLDNAGNWKQAGTFNISDLKGENLKLGFASWLNGGVVFTPTYKNIKIAKASETDSSMNGIEPIALCESFANSALDHTSSKIYMSGEMNTNETLKVKLSHDEASQVLFVFDNNGHVSYSLANINEFIDYKVNYEGKLSISAIVFDEYGKPSDIQLLKEEMIVLKDNNHYSLKHLYINGNEVKGFKEDLYEYTYDIPYNASSVRLSFDESDANRETLITGQTSVTLNKGQNAVVLDYNDQYTIKRGDITYTVYMNQLKNNDNQLLLLSVGDKTIDLNDEIVEGTESYFVKTDQDHLKIRLETSQDVSSIDVTHSYYETKVQDINDSNYIFEANIDMYAGINAYYIYIMGADGKTLREVKLYLFNDNYSDSSLNDISINGQTINDFNKNQEEYEIRTDKTGTYRISASGKEGTDITIVSNGEIIASKNADIELVSGLNQIVIMSKAKDIWSRSYYVLNVIVESDDNADLLTLQTSEKLDHSFDPNVLQYKASNNNGRFKVSAKSQVDEAIITMHTLNQKVSAKGYIEHEFHLKEGQNIIYVDVKAKDGHVKTYSIEVEAKGLVYASDVIANSKLEGITNTKAQVGYDKIKLDVNVNGNAFIQLPDESGYPITFDKGLATHASSEVIYTFDKGHEFEKFESYIGVDYVQYHINQSSVTFKVYVDNELVYDSYDNHGITSAHTPMQFISVDIKDARELRLVVTDGNGSINYDHAEWAGACFTRPIVLSDSVDAQRVTLNKDTVELTAGESVSLTATVLPEDTTDKTVTWTSSDETIATVKDGVVTAVKAGTATITVATANGLTDTITITVKAKEKPFPFEDVFKGQWYYEYVDQAYQLGLMTGATETLFKPTVSMNRGMVAIVLHRMEGAEKVAYAPIFPDVYNNQYFTTAVMWAKQTGIITGYNNGTFMPLKNVTREEMATMIQRFATYKGLDVASSKDITYFQDYADISTYAKAPIQWCVENGVLSGKFAGTKVDPLGTATRAECAKMLVQAYKVIYK